jgi:hypothetical protein
MIEITNQKKKEIEFVINTLKNICSRRNYEKIIIKCDLYLNVINNFSKSLTDEEFFELKTDILNTIDDLLQIIKMEIRYFLFPFLEIKKDTYEFGKQYINNFLEWYKDYSNYPVEDIMKILNDDLYLLEESKKILIQNNE